MSQDITLHLAEFEREVDAFEQLKPQLLAQYAGKVVAIRHGQVIMSGNDKLAVLDAVLEKYGAITPYIEWVEDIAPRAVRLPTARAAR